VLTTVISDSPNAKGS